ncbi:MAG: CoA pyrophosphatase [Desulfobulbaceae bacterium]|jgi:8-oxo-dGTP pyrophosphatase MutT (NUDIX family)|nr:CoA pyrophosphatase [Desulfobulbaceae bacterium]
METAAAVAVIVATEPQKSILLLRRRASPDDPWSGHFSFPGGRRDPGDTDLLATCLRETAEETGIILPEKSFRKMLPAAPVGRLMRIHMLVQPYLFRLSEKPKISVNPLEIASAHWLDVAAFRDETRHHEREMVPGINFSTFPLEDYYLWGFTYGVLRRLLAADN